MKMLFTFYIYRTRRATSCEETHQVQNVMTCPLFVNIELLVAKRPIIVCEQSDRAFTDRGK